MKIFLVGLPGSGKTTLGAEIAKKLDLPFVDLDYDIARIEKRSIASIFESEGEARFRELESQHLKNWCDRKEDFLMATGGGTPCFYANIDLMNKVGVSVSLDTSVEVIAKRMKNTELGRRPLFADQTVETIAGRVSQMRRERICYYQQAKLIYADDTQHIDHITKQLKAPEG